MVGNDLAGSEAADDVQLLGIDLPKCLPMCYIISVIDRSYFVAMFHSEPSAFTLF